MGSRLSSEIKLCAKLYDAWRVRADYLSQSGACEVSVHGTGSIELGVVEAVEGFQP